MKKGYIYILKCANGNFYTGSTIDLERRLRQHQQGKGANYTRKHRPVVLVYHQEFPTIQEAFRREKQIQGWSHAKKQALIDGDFDRLESLAERSSVSNLRTLRTLRTPSLSRCRNVEMSR
jgi:putative endonuclease